MREFCESYELSQGSDCCWLEYALMDAEMLVTFVTPVVSKTAYQKEVQHSCAIQLPWYKEGILGDVLPPSFRYLHLDLLLWAPSAAKEEQSLLGECSSDPDAEV